MTDSTAPQPMHHTLSVAEACDLELVGSGVLPSGTLLGAPLVALTAPDDGDPASGPLIAVTLSEPLRPLVNGESTSTVTLRDDEQTPLAVLQDARVVAAAPTGVVRGRLDLRRPRESGVLGDMRLDLVAARGSAPDVLMLGRIPVDADLPDLKRWRDGVSARPLVLVGEGGEHRDHPPAVVGVRVASWLTAHLELPGAQIRVSPLRGRDPLTDHHLATALVEHLRPRRSLVLTPTTPTEGAAAWVAAAAHLREGRPGPVPGVHPDVAVLLRRWLPARADRGLVLLLTGLSGSGKSTLARDLNRYLLLQTDRRARLLDGDVVRRQLSSGLGFDLASRETNVRRIGWVAARIAEQGGTAICAPIAPFDRTRQEVRAMAQEVGDFLLVHVSTPLAECERRDLKELYARARAGQVADFTGISSPYEPPDDADLVLDTSELSREEALERLVTLLVRRQYVPERGESPAGQASGAPPATL